MNKCPKCGEDTPHTDFESFGHCLACEFKDNYYEDTVEMYSHESNPKCTHSLYPSSCYPIRSGIMKSCAECIRNMGNIITISKE